LLKYVIKKRVFDKKFITLFILLNLLPYILFFVQRNSYAFINELDVFAFMFDGIFVILFIFFLILLFLPELLSILKDRFIIYQRVRISLYTILSSMFFANAIISFLVFFFLVFHVFCFCFYIIPNTGIIKFYPEVAHLKNGSQEMMQFDINRYTFSQLLEFNKLAYGLFYALWVGLIASGYAMLSYFSLLLFKNKLMGLLIPIFIYIAASYVSSMLEILEPFGLANAVFPFSMQQYDITTMSINLVYIYIVNLILYIFTFKKMIKNIYGTI